VFVVIGMASSWLVYHLTDLGVQSKSVSVA